MIWKQLAFVFLGGGLGSITRFLISIGLLKYTKHFPLGTLASNILATLLLSVFLFYIQSKETSQDLLRLLLITGFCGGFSTFSTFSYETFELLKSGHTPLAILNILISVLLALFSLYIVFKFYNQI
jgi:CrcB protein